MEKMSMKKIMASWVLLLLMVMGASSTAAAKEPELYCATGEEYLKEHAVYSLPSGEDVLHGESQYPWEAELRARIRNALASYQKQIYCDDLEITCTTSEFTDIFFDELYKNPQFFYATSQVSYTYDCTYLGLYYLDKYMLDDKTVNTALIETDRAIYESRISQALSNLDGMMTDLEKVLAVHEFIVSSCDYALESTDEMYSSYGVFVNNTAVCQGYALAMIDCLNRLGFSNCYITSDAMDHAWNMVYLDGYWYHIDATWDDPLNGIGIIDGWREGFVEHDDFLLSDEEIMGTGHYDWNADAPKATNSNSYAGYCFRDDYYINSPFWYYKGHWYVAKQGEKQSDVYRISIDGTEWLKLRTESGCRRLQMYNGVMYFADNNGIYMTKAPGFNNARACRLFSQEAGYEESVITELCIKSGQLIVELYNGQYERLVMPLQDGSGLPESYLVYFATNGGESLETMTTAEAGQLVYEPVQPIKQGYRFWGWYQDAALTDEWDFDVDRIYAETTLYAKWEKRSKNDNPLKLNWTDVKLQIGDTLTLKVVGLPEDASNEGLVWNSSNPAVAAVENGVVNALALGSSTITVTTADGQMLSSQITVLEEIVKVTQIERECKEQYWYVGESYTILPTIYPQNASNKELYWESDNPAVTVEDGVVTVKERGDFFPSVTITLSTADGCSSTYYVGFYERTKENAFSDVPEGWELDASFYVFEKDIMTGKGRETTGMCQIIFKPHDNLLREEFAQIIYALEGKPEVETKVSFSDVASDQWYTDAVLWAGENGIVSGYPDGSYGVGNPIRREELAAMLYKYAEYKGYDISESTSLEQFADSATASDWAVERLQWAVAKGVMSGNGTNLNPTGSAMRSECAAMLRSFLENVGTASKTSEF